MGVISRGLQQIIYLQSGDVERDDAGRLRYLLQNEWISVFEFDGVNSIGVSDAVDSQQKYGALLLAYKADGFLCGIAVEKILASEEHVVKPLGRFAYKPMGVTGAAILGSGRVAPVVDLNDLPVLRFTDDEVEAWNKNKSLMLERQLLPFTQKPIALVVDDSLSARRALAQFMSDLGYEVLSAKDGFEAIAQMAIKVPHVALIDLEMPRMNGLELAAHMRSQQSYSGVPIVMITSRTTAKHKLLADNAGVDVYLNKPWSDDELMSALTQLLPTLDRAVGE
jgi:CheY-like chemotaxis protein